MQLNNPETLMRTRASRTSASTSALVERACKLLPGSLFLVAGLGLATTAWAQSAQDTGTGGGENVCWGQTASKLAKLSDPSVTGGGMGAHSRSETAADINGGFANSSNPFGQDQPRDGVGNVSEDVHGVPPGDGGNGIHAANNGEILTAVRNPVTGDLASLEDQVVLESDCTGTFEVP